MVFVAPEDGRLNAGRWRDVCAADLEHAGDEGAGAPVAHGEKAAGLEDACALGGDELRARGEHGAEHGGDGVEGGVAVGKGFGVALVEGDGEAFVGGAGAGLLEQVECDVDAGNDAAAAGEWNGDVAGAAGDVKDAGAGGYVETGDEVFCAGGDGLGDDAEVAGHPTGTHVGLDLLDGGGSCAHCVISL